MNHFLKNSDPLDSFSQQDKRYMSMAIDLAKKGVTTVTPNPAVGCVIVKNNTVIGQGFHEQAGKPHAEIIAIDQAMKAGHLLLGSTFFITLEPCCHIGKTPACIDAILSVNPARVVFATPDPNPLTKGRSLDKLRSKNIHAQYGLLSTDALRLNLGFFSRMIRSRPWVTLKLASSLDGKLALSNGTSQWISNLQSRQDAHQKRALSCAILTGCGTILHDNPQLTVRHHSTARQPKTIILDKNLSIPIESNVIRKGTLIFCHTKTNQNKITALEKAGAKLIYSNQTDDSLDLASILHHLSTVEEINELLLETGPKLTGAFYSEKLIDEICLYWSPNALGHLAMDMLVMKEAAGLPDPEDRTWTMTQTKQLGNNLNILLENQQSFETLTNAAH